MKEKYIEIELKGKGAREFFNRYKNCTKKELIQHLATLHLHNRVMVEEKEAAEKKRTVLEKKLEQFF